MNYPASFSRLGIISFLLFNGLSLGKVNLPAKAQIIPDATLGLESSAVGSGTIEGVEVDLIEGGAQRDTNLFHSFEQLNVNELQRVYFSNPIGIETILSRVTGRDASTIMGTLGVNGSADLFLLNPNGIFFGSNARLDVGGSFVATTADAFDFSEPGTFSARSPVMPSPLLTVAPSAFLFGPIPAGDIVTQSRVADDDFPLY